MTGRGRPPIGPATTIRLEPELKQALEAIAHQYNLPLAGLIRTVLDNFAEQRFDNYYARGGQGLADDVWRRITGDDASCGG